MTAIKAISLWQPWASAIALGNKAIETRSWRTAYRGPILIHAARKFTVFAKSFAATERALGRMPARVPLGAIVAMAQLVACEPTEELNLSISALERMYGDYSFGRWGWVLKDVMAFTEPVGYRGAQGLFEVPQSAVAEALAKSTAVERQVSHAS